MSDWMDGAPRTLFVTTTTVRAARKNHCCYLCGRIISRGSPYTVITGMTDEDPHPTRLKMHNGARACASAGDTEAQQWLAGKDISW